MLNIHDKGHNFILFSEIKKSIITKCAFEFFDSGAKKEFFLNFG